MFSNIISPRRAHKHRAFIDQLTDYFRMMLLLLWAARACDGGGKCIYLIGKYTHIATQKTEIYLKKKEILICFTRQFLFQEKLH